MSQENNAPTTEKKKSGCLIKGVYGFIGLVCVLGLLSMFEDVDSSDDTLVAMDANQRSGDTENIKKFDKKGVMPTDERTLEKLSEASGQAVMRLFDKIDKMTPVIMSSVSFRYAVQDIGYDPDKTVLYWLSPEHQKNIQSMSMQEAMEASMGSGLLLGQALGDGSSKKEFERLLSYWSPEVQEAARKRRSNK